MRTLLKRSAIALISFVAFSGIAAGQGYVQNQTYTQNKNVFADKLPDGPGGPAPRHDLNGTWVGPIGAKGTLPGRRSGANSAGETAAERKQARGEV